MEGKGSLFNIVLLVILAFLSLSVCILAGYVFFGGGGSSKASNAESAKKVEITVPKDDELTSLSVFGDESKVFNLKKVSNNEIAMIRVKVILQYRNKAAGIKDTTAKITTYSDEIQSLIGTYFMNMTLTEAQNAKTKTEAAPAYLKKEINKLLVENEKTKSEIVYKVFFTDWLYQ